MDYLRQFADAGVAVIVVSAVGCGKDSKGRSSYAGDALSLASFRESSEVEFGADDAFILVPDAEDADSVTLRHLKSRHGEARDIALAFRPSAAAVHVGRCLHGARRGPAAIYAGGPVGGDRCGRGRCEGYGR